MIGRGARLAPRIYELLVEAANGADIEYTVEASGSSTHTDADSIQVSRAGIPHGLVSIPLSQMRSPARGRRPRGRRRRRRGFLVAFAERL